MVSKTFDSKGRIALGLQYAGQTAMVEVSADGRIVIELTPVALGAVREGLRQARNGEFSQSPPDLKADAGLADAIED
jgi:hypothetical protein